MERERERTRDDGMEHATAGHVMTDLSRWCGDGDDKTRRKACMWLPDED